MTISIKPIPAFNDNYFWVIADQHNALIVDPGDAQVSESYLDRHQLNLVAILVTHHHHDHIGGVSKLKQRFGCRVWGPVDDRITSIDIRCHHQDKIVIPPLNLEFQVIFVPGHTRSHIAYYLAPSENDSGIKSGLDSDINSGALFCGDTLFSAGCGRLFEGTAAQMWHSLQQIAALPGKTKVYPAHEYTLSNLAFAKTVDPQNQALNQYQQKVVKLRQQNLPSLPTTIEQERAINPFLRVQQSALIESAGQNFEMAATDPHDTAHVFSIIRQLKDQF